MDVVFPEQSTLMCMVLDANLWPAPITSTTEPSAIATITSTSEPAAAAAASTESALCIDGKHYRIRQRRRLWCYSCHGNKHRAVVGREEFRTDKCRLHGR